MCVGAAVTDLLVRLLTVELFIFKAQIDVVCYRLRKRRPNRFHFHITLIKYLNRAISRPLAVFHPALLEFRVLTSYSP